MQTAHEQRKGKIMRSLLIAMNKFVVWTNGNGRRSESHDKSTLAGRRARGQRAVGCACGNVAIKSTSMRGRWLHHNRIKTHNNNNNNNRLNVRRLFVIFFLLFIRLAWLFHFLFNGQRCSNLIHWMNSRTQISFTMMCHKACRMNGTPKMK